jgi:hypothetical protein
MTQVFEHPYTLIKSIHSSKTDLNTFSQSNTPVISDGTDTEIKTKNKAYNRINVPKRTGPKNYELQCCEPEKRKLHEKPSSLKPNVVTLIDPVSGFLSCTGEILLETGKMHIENMGKTRKEPHTTIPQNINSIRDNEAAIDEIKRGFDGKEGPRLKWNSRKVPDRALRARLGGWTSDFNILKLKKDPNIVQRGIQELFPVHLKTDNFSN